MEFVFAHPTLAVEATITVHVIEGSTDFTARFIASTLKSVIIRAIMIDILHNARLNPDLLLSACLGLTLTCLAASNALITTNLCSLYPEAISALN
ncbi:hypothetical protein E2562_014246 [Oryza meyeriana var. granulata]|uniref:Uncharacterized protein n=1 Tax=Oryza meyeriana var. granulata TaxID=110450 RepID=A0A6G1BL06_9ORYZ|nr:hypothetical protein E2562_014246 [Oryza meyeriana var. granulata]